MPKLNCQDKSHRLRFAPSPNGRLHLGHAYSAFLNQHLASELNGELMLRIEDIDLTRCTPELEQAIYEDLTWLGLSFSGGVRRQSDHFDVYAASLQRLIDQGLAYPAQMTRGEIKSFVKTCEEAGQQWPRDPDGAALYPGIERNFSSSGRDKIIHGGEPFAWRLDMAQAISLISEPLTWLESGTGAVQEIVADPTIWGDVILSRSDAASSYHLSVVVDDALQGISHVVRGQDLYHATAVHRLLQALLDLPSPTYHHHRLILDGDGKKLSKSIKSTGIHELRASGLTPLDIRTLVGL